MSFHQVQVRTKGKILKPLTEIMSDVVQIRHVDDEGIATVVHADNSRSTIQLANGQQWIADNKL